MAMHTKGGTRRSPAVLDPSVPFKAGCMGLGTLWTLKQKLATDPRYRIFRYVFSTESDQIPHLRDLDVLTGALAAARRRGSYAAPSGGNKTPVWAGFAASDCGRCPRFNAVDKRT